MKLCLRILTLLLVVSGTLSQDFDLGDALDDLDPTPAKPKEKPKSPGGSDSDFGLDLGDALGPDTKPDKPTVKPPKDGGGGGGFGFDLEDAIGPDPKPDKPDKPAVKPPKGGGDGGFNLDDALGPDLNPKPNKPVKPPPSGGGGGKFDDSDLLDVSGGNYKPDGGHAGGSNSNYDPHGGADQPQEAGSGPIAGIISAVGVALVGAASSYFAYQKKKLCFKIQGGRDPESGNGQVRSDPQVYSDLLRTS